MDGMTSNDDDTLVGDMESNDYDTFVGDMESNEVDTLLAPYEGLEFSTHEDAYIYYNSYAKKKGFGIRREAFDKLRSNPSKIVSRTYVCNKAGWKKLSDKREFGKLVQRKPDTRVGCGAKMKIRLTSTNKWVVQKFVEEHSNHELTSPDKVLMHYSHKQKHRSGPIRKAMGDLSDVGMGPSNIARVLNVGYEVNDGVRITP
jgi:hypothetical protein